jgi:hypothetical protein
MGTLEVMNQSLWKFNYVTALQIAEKNGGLDWRSNNKPDTVKITLKHTLPNNWLTWTIDYRSGTNDFIKVIDANSGQVIEENQASTTSQ